MLSCSSTAASTIEATVTEFLSQHSTVIVIKSPVIYAAPISIRWTKLGIPETASSTAEPSSSLSTPSSLSSLSAGAALSFDLTLQAVNYP